MPYIGWHPTSFLVFFCMNLVVSVVPQTTTLDRTTTTTETARVTSVTQRAYDCPAPPVLKNGYYHGQHLSATSIRYYCNFGYKLIGDSLFFCWIAGDRNRYAQSDSQKRFKLQWLPDFSGTRCEPTTTTTTTTTTTKKPKSEFQRPCLLPHPKDQNLVIRDWRRDYPVGSGVVYMCQNGYEIVGHHVRLCKSGGKWSPEEEPSCKDIWKIVSVPPLTTPSKKESLTIINIILYISIPLLAVFILAVVCNLKRQCAKRNRHRQSRVRTSTAEPGDTRYPQLLPTSATGYAGLIGHPYQPTTFPTAPLPHLLNYDELIVPFTEVENAPSVPVIQEPPSYEEATRDSSLPSFEVAQKLHNSSTNISHHSRENLH